MNWRGLRTFLWFSIRHSWRDMARSRGRTLFALICVATGVAAVVALRSLAFMVGDKLTTSLAELNRGDVRVYASTGVPELIELSEQRTPLFNAEALALAREWADYEGVDLTVGRMDYLTQITVIKDGEAQTAGLAQALFVEPEIYPFYDTVWLREPGNTTLAEFYAQADRSAAGTLDDPRPIVISNNLAREHGLSLEVGDMIKLGAAEVYYRVAAVASLSAESMLTNPQVAFLGDYVYLPFDELVQLGEPTLPDQLFIRVPLGRDINAVEASLIEYLQASFDTSRSFSKELNRSSVPELEKQNAQTADIIDDLILTMGLSSLLIGGIGIINTMLVVVSRRTLEVAVLKTLGLKAYRVTFLFLVEALLLGLIGSLIGIGIGVGLSYAIRDVGEEAFKLALTWRLYPAAMLSGLFLGLVMTGLFGFLPTLIAGQVRPAIVLRPNEAQMPAAGLLQTLAAIVVMITIMGLLVSSIVGAAIDYGPVYMVAGGGALVGLFAGVIVANTRLGKPIPVNYVFRLARRFERLELRLNHAAGALVGWLPLRWAAAERTERGRAAITFSLRALRQSVLIYGALAIGAGAASGLMLIASELWLPLQIGDVKPANDVFFALERHDLIWVAIWLGLTVGVAYLIRRYARAVVGVLALGSLGTTLGGLVGWLGGLMLDRMLADTGAWQILAEMSTGVVLVEGAMALMAVIYVLYWLTVWVVGKLPNSVFMGVVGVIVLTLAAGLAAGLALLGPVVLALVTVGLGVIWLSLRISQAPRGHSSRAVTNGAAEMAQIALRARSTPVVLLSVVAMGGGLLLVDVTGIPQIRLVVGLIVLFGLWRFFQRHFAIDGRLILREMSGRRARVASTLLGLSVGVAGLSVVSLTTGAVSHLLEVQLVENAEGNLLVFDLASRQAGAVQQVLDDAEGVESYSQITVYNAVLMKINGEQVETRRQMQDERDMPQENSSLETYEHGIGMGLTVRDLATIPDYKMKAGRALGPDDEGQAVIMLRESFITETFGIEVGDRVQYLFENDPGEDDDLLLQFRVIGIVSRQSEQSGLEELFYLSMVPPGTPMDTVQPNGVATIAQIDESDDVYMDQVLVALAGVPGVFAIEVGVLTQLVQSLLDQLRAIPTLVAWLALVAGSAIIANTVALATQERRRQIGVMKAVGLKGPRVLGMLIIENGLIGLIAGLIGVGAGFVLTVALVLTSQNPGELLDTIEFSTMGWLIVMSIGVAMVAAILSAWSAAAEKPMNVLRYE